MSQRTSSSYRKQSNLSCFLLQSWSLFSSHVRSKTRPHGCGVEAEDGLLRKKRRKGDDTWRRDLMTSVNTKSTIVTYRLKLQSHITQEELVFYHSLRFFIVPKTTLITTFEVANMILMSEQHILVTLHIPCAEKITTREGNSIFRW